MAKPNKLQYLPSILLISSNTHTTDLLTDILQDAGFKLEFAHNMEEGIQKAIDILPSIITIEKSPNISSLETCRKLRQHKILEDIPLVMVIGKGEVDEKASGLSCGVDDFLDKPFEEVQVLARFRSLTKFNRKHYLLADLSRFSWMVEHAQEGYLMLDNSGNIHYANERGARLLNLPEDFFGLPFMRVVEKQYVVKPEETWQGWLEDPAPCFLVQPESPTARAFWVVLEAHEPPEGLEYLRLVRLRDVTERMSIYQDMRRFHTIITHKLRTPMSMMNMSLTLMKKQLEVLSPAEIKDYLNSAIKGADRLADEIRAILSYIDAPLALNLGNPMVVKELKEMIRSLAKNLGIEKISLSIPDALLGEVMAITPDAMEMILHELFQNSRKHHPAHAPQIEVNISQTNAEYIQFIISDNGLNLSNEQLNWAWLPYFQGEKDFTGENPGLGLGFPMVATLVWKAGGAINLNNRADMPGITVKISIPLESTMQKMERDAAPFGA